MKLTEIKQKEKNKTETKTEPITDNNECVEKFLQLSFFQGVASQQLILNNKKKQTETKTLTIQQMGILTMNFNKTEMVK